MSENEFPSNDEVTDEDVQGHHVSATDDDGKDDVEGHRVFSATDDEDDVQGHRVFSATDDEDAAGFASAMPSDRDIDHPKS